MADRFDSKFQLLRARIESGTKNSSVIMVTSAQANDGKSLVAHGLASGLHDVGHRVALVDTALAPSAPADARARDSRTGDFPVLSLATDMSRPAASREWIRSFIEQLRHDFEYTVIDAAPLMTDTTAMVLAATVDSVLVAVRHGRSPGEADDLMVQTLTHLKANVLGVIASSPRHISEFARRKGVSASGATRIVVVEARVDDVPGSALFAK
jgi:succinoglycan biosynthesis transport protein ExoP